MPVVITQADTTLAIDKWQYQIEMDGRPNVGVRFGRGTNLLVQSFDFGSAEVTNADWGRVVEDGIGFGQDFLGPRTVTIEASAWVRTEEFPDKDDRAEAVQQYAELLEETWHDSDLRADAETYAVLRYNRGRGVRRLYGRPRAFAGVGGRMISGVLPITASFQANDHQSYDDTSSQVLIEMDFEEHSGLVAPLTDPLTAGQSNAEGSQVADITGRGTSWPVVTFKGPITNPRCNIVGQYEVGLNYTIAYDEEVTIDSQPWHRGVRSNLHGNLNGKLTPDTPRFGRMGLRRDEYLLDFLGASPTNTAQMTFKWRNAHPGV